MKIQCAYLEEEVKRSIHKLKDHAKYSMKNAFKDKVEELGLKFYVNQNYF